MFLISLFRTIRVSHFVRLSSSFIFSLIILAPQAMADQQTDFNALMIKAEQVINSHRSAYNQTLNYDGKYPHSHSLTWEDEVKQLKKEFKKITEKERSNIIEKVSLSITSVSQEKEKILLMTKVEVEKERKKYQENIDKFLSEKKIEDDKRYAEANARRAAYQEDKRIKMSSSTYYRDQFRADESKLFTVFNKLFNTDGKVNIYYFKYYPDYVGREIEAASSQMDINRIYIKYINEIEKLIYEMRNMSEEQIKQRREEGLIWSRHAKLVGEQRALVLDLDSLKAKLTLLVEALDDIPQESCTRTEVNYNCGSQCEVMRKDPIFGTYSSDFDRSCMNRCRSGEEAKQEEFDREESGCFQEQRDNKREFQEFKGDYDHARKIYQRKYDRYSEIEKELESIYRSLR